MRYLPSIACILLILLGTSGVAYGGAWTQAKDNGLLILNHAYYRASEFVNNAGKTQKQALYQKAEWNPYIEYGVNDRLTIGANLFLQYIRQQTTRSFVFQPDPFTTIITTFKGNQNNVGIGDSEFFARYRLYQKDGFVFSVEPMYKLPSLWSYMPVPDIGNSNPEASLTLSGGYGFKAYGRHHFANIDTGYRYRSGREKDQVRIAGTLGLSLDPQWTIMPQVFITQRTGNTKARAAFTENSSNDYNLTKLQLSAIYHHWDETSIQVGGFLHADAKNTSTGGGLFIALWRNF